MKDVVNDINRWLAENTAVSLATVVQTWGSAPRRVGAKMAVTADGRFCGSVSGGCVEGAVIEASQQILAGGQARLLRYGVADETAWDVGLACGGSIEIFVQPLDTAVFHFLHAAIQNETAATAMTIIQGTPAQTGRTMAFDEAGRQVGTLGSPALDAQAREAAANIRQPAKLPLADDVVLFVDPIRPSPRLVMVGGVHIAQALAPIAQTVGFHTTLIDPRRSFASQERFAHVDRLIQAWPEKAFKEVVVTTETAVALLTHDPKIDDPALKVVLNSPAFYIGALGSRSTHAKRKERLREMGFSETAVARIHAPIGLDIGATTPEQIALAVMAEIVQAYNG